MTEKTRKLCYFIVKLASVLVSCAFPIRAVSEHFPIWVASHGAARSIGAGGIICLVVVAVVFRRSVFDFLRERLRLRHAPPLAVWLALLAVSYLFIYITPFVRDLTAVFWFGLLGCAIGTAMTYVAERFFGRGEADRG